jgi:hypothetical protein
MAYQPEVCDFNPPSCRIATPMQFANPLVSDAGNFFVADKTELERIMAIFRAGL